MLRLPHNCTNLHASKEMLQILQFRLQQCVNQELSYVQAAFRKSWGTRDQNYQHPLDHRKSKRIQKNIISSVQPLSRVRLLATSWTIVCQASLSITNSWSHQLLESTQTHVHCVGDAIQTSHPLSSPLSILLPSMFRSIRVFSNESALRIR